MSTATLARLHERADRILREQAIASLTEKLKSGGKVGRCHLVDLLDAELDSRERYPIALPKVFQILTAESGERAALCDQFVDGLIERYLDSHPEFVEEEAHALEAEGPDPCDLARGATIAAEQA